MSKRLFLFIMILSCILTSIPAYPASIYSDLQHGFYADTRGQIGEYERIAPPHEENIPALTPTQTTTPFMFYYETNFKGRRQPDNKVPLILIVMFGITNILLIHTKKKHIFRCGVPDKLM